MCGFQKNFGICVQKYNLFWFSLTFAQQMIVPNTNAKWTGINSDIYIVNAHQAGTDRMKASRPKSVVMYMKKLEMIFGIIKNTGAIFFIPTYKISVIFSTCWFVSRKTEYDAEYLRSKMFERNSLVNRPLSFGIWLCCHTYWRWQYIRSHLLACISNSTAKS